MRLLIPTLLLAGCAQLGAESPFREFSNLPEGSTISGCQMIRGTTAIDGVYTNSNGQLVTVLEFNDGCDNIAELSNGNEAVTFK